MTYVGRPCVGIVCRKKDGTTYTEWYHAQAFNYPAPSVDEWVKDKMWWKGRVFDTMNIMCIVRAI
jgi:hypothetical protein